MTYLLDAILDSSHQAFKMLPENCQAPWVQHQPAMAGGGSARSARGRSGSPSMTAPARGSRMGVGLVRQRDLLLLMKDLGLGRREAELRNGDRGRKG